MQKKNVQGFNCHYLVFQRSALIVRYCITKSFQAKLHFSSVNCNYSIIPMQTQHIEICNFHKIHFINQVKWAKMAVAGSVKIKLVNLSRFWKSFALKSCVANSFAVSSQLGSNNPGQQCQFPLDASGPPKNKLSPKKKNYPLLLTKKIHRPNNENFKCVRKSRAFHHIRPTALSQLLSGISCFQKTFSLSSPSPSCSILYLVK